MCMCVCAHYNPAIYKVFILFSKSLLLCLVQEPSFYVVPELRYEGRCNLHSIIGTIRHLYAQCGRLIIRFKFEGIFGSFTASISILQMYGGGQMRLVLVLSVLSAVFCLATATNCTSQSKSIISH